MLRLPRTVRVFARTRPTSSNARADVLMGLVRDELGADAFADAFAVEVYCFFNARRTSVKLLVWDRNGFWVMSKRLERGRFEQLDARTPWLELAREELVMLLAGIDTKTARFRHRFAREIRIQSRANDERPRAAP